MGPKVCTNGGVTHINGTRGDRRKIGAKRHLQSIVIRLFLPCIAEVLVCLAPMQVVLF